MSKHKLTDQEIAAFLDNFDISDVRIRNLWSQKALFIVSFWFVNVYVLFYIIGHAAFPDIMMKFEHLIELKAEYAALLNARSVVGLVLLCFAYSIWHSSLPITFVLSPLSDLHTLPMPRLML